MMRASHLILIVAAVVLCGCSVGIRKKSGPLRVPAGGPQNAQEMVADWDGRTKAERTCARDIAGQQLSRKDNENNPRCRDYRP